MQTYQFRRALPVWESGKEETLNYHLAFRTVIEGKESARIALSASAIYQMYLNGKMIAEGPARAGHGHHRVDEIDLTPHLTEGRNVLVVYVAGYYLECFCFTREPSFFCAEVLRGDTVLAATGVGGFEARTLAECPRRLERFSYQRTFCEYYRLTGNTRAYERDPDATLPDAVFVSTVAPKRFLTRDVPYPSYEEQPAVEQIGAGQVVFSDLPIEPNRTRFVDLVPDCDGFPLETLALCNNDEVEKGSYTLTSRAVRPFGECVIPPMGYAVFRLAGNRCGFLHLNVTAESDSRMLVVFDELDTDGDVSTRRITETASNAIWDLSRGRYELWSREPYGMQYIKVINRSDAPLTLHSLSLTSYVFDLAVPKLESGDETLDRIYAAAVESFRQNTLDVYMDCVTRERAGWLCDSFFTSRVERELTGKSLVERAFLENFLMTDTYPHHPEGMIPMCYPADVRSGMFIPNWSMWYILQLEEYYARTGDRDLIDRSRKKVEGLYNYFSRFKNADGLLEGLESWVFVEWSSANDFVQDVNYPSNMLWARTLRAIASLYGNDALLAEADAIRDTVREQSLFDGFFHDHAVRDTDGTLFVVSEDISETCQYYAFFTGVATPETDPALWQTLRCEFGSKRDASRTHPGVGISNAFVGNYLRLELLLRYGDEEQVLADIKGFFTHMARTTGTLWEHQNAGASCNHGFASHVIVWLHKILKKGNK